MIRCPLCDRELAVGELWMLHMCMPVLSSLSFDVPNRSTSIRFTSGYGWRLHGRYNKVIDSLCIPDITDLMRG